MQREYMINNIMHKMRVSKRSKCKTTKKTKKKCTTTNRTYTLYIYIVPLGKHLSTKYLNFHGNFIVKKKLEKHIIYEKYNVYVCIYNKYKH